LAINLKSMNAGELLALRNDIDDALLKMRKELEGQLEKIGSLGGGARRKAAAKRGPKPGKRRSRLAGKKVPAKYRNPANPKETWAGRGMKPRWLVAAEKAGKKLESFAVK